MCHWNSCSWGEKLGCRWNSCLSRVKIPSLRLSGEGAAPRGLQLFIFTGITRQWTILRLVDVSWCLNKLSNKTLDNCICLVTPSCFILPLPPNKTYLHKKSNHQRKLLDITPYVWPKGRSILAGAKLHKMVSRSNTNSKEIDQETKKRKILQTFCRPITRPCEKKSFLRSLCCCLCLVL